MNQYRVTWEMDIEADTPRQAAEKALSVQRNESSMSTVFQVFGESIPGGSEYIDPNVEEE